jgi:hypothetical protein
MESLNSFFLVVLCFASFVISFFGSAQGVVLLIRLLTFTMPFSKKLTERRVYDRSVHKRLLITEGVELVIIIAVSAGLSMLLIIFGETPCAIVLIAGFAMRLIYSLAINKAAIGMTAHNVNAYRKAHSAVMNMERFEQYVRRM